MPKKACWRLLRSRLQPKRKILEKNMKKIEKAKLFLKTLLRDEPFPSGKILDSIEAEGLGESTLRSAKRELGIEAYRHGGKDGKWLWKLPVEESEPKIKDGENDISQKDKPEDQDFKDVEKSKDGEPEFKDGEPEFKDGKKTKDSKNIKDGNVKKGDLSWEKIAERIKTMRERHCHQRDSKGKEN